MLVVDTYAHTFDKASLREKQGIIKRKFTFPTAMTKAESHISDQKS